MRTRRRAQIDQLVQPGGGLSDLLDRVAQTRGRPVHLVPAELGPEAPSGLWLSTPAADYIAYPSDAPPTRRALIICHELAHMVLGHELSDPDPEALAAVAAPAMDSAVAARFLRRHDYATPAERDAEMLATRLMAAIAYDADAARFDDRLR